MNGKYPTDWDCKVTVHKSLFKRALQSRSLMAVCALFTLMIATHFTLNFLCWFTCEVLFKA
ncbi:hypothetical protein BS639_23610 [Rouxiella silvae]|uniref:Uncharacterized protein n=1 Tax=Rouxiella silvae TaxID=1646373 RepID=A0ABX3TU64_9GAMM|nr:hypothetical protein ASE93_20970 [Serratia sp. Leaf50]ORJ18767.1 hypothetical protein BS639_23610 [Rouxiella silvae]